MGRPLSPASPLDPETRAILYWAASQKTGRVNINEFYEEQKAIEDAAKADAKADAEAEKRAKKREKQAAKRAQSKQQQQEKPEDDVNDEVEKLLNQV